VRLGEPCLVAAHLRSVETKKSVAVVLKELGKKDAQIKAHRNTMVDRDEGKEIALGTSKLNYIDPRLTFAWCKKFEVPIEKFFSKTLREKCVCLPFPKLV
jgi:DNA topoisomerase-1